MNNFESSLLAMKHLLSYVGEERWAIRIDEDIEHWHATGDTSLHLSAYGGRGTLNDVVICRVNQHRISESQEPWANYLFGVLKSICYFLAQQPNKQITADALSAVVRCSSSPLVQLMMGHKWIAPVKTIGTVTPNLQGWRCLQCGYSEISHQAIDLFIAENLVPELIVRDWNSSPLIDLVDKVLAFKIPTSDEARLLLTDAANSSDMIIRERTGWMRPCPKCEHDGTAVYRWQLEPLLPLHFKPSVDNLPLASRHFQ
jgi:hypothetical protein